MFEWKSALAVVLELLVVCGLATLPSQSDFFLNSSSTPFIYSWWWHGLLSSWLDFL